MDYKESLEYMYNTPQFSVPGLDRMHRMNRMRSILNALGNPQNHLKFVHIAGTNGKGSCAIFLSSVLKTAGYRTGLFISPHLRTFNERMLINGKEIENDDLARIATAVRTAEEKNELPLTAFERMTVAALTWFGENKCDIVVLETGLGGRLDATNVIDTPEATVIMNIGMDHEAVLGNTLEAIAAEKAGILKRGCPCVLYPQTDCVETVIRTVCAQQNAELILADFTSILPIFDSLDGQAFSYNGSTYAISLLGAHQIRNAAVAIETIELLRRRGWKISPEALEHGLYAASWPARFEILSDDPYVVLDGSHNPQGAETLADSLRSYFPEQQHIFLVGVMKDKDYASVFSILNPVADAYICISPDSPRALPCEALAAFLQPFGKPVITCATIEDGIFTAIEKARNRSGMVCAAGSLYLAGEIRACMGMY